ncbi:unnamed protein product [[Actinomadura] parvosata subsp. kistnae]|uniref:hypothetical protein n=1 Tax=[Actinomadura] parvosata TaxID=1955412 RepID=UPI000D29539B|nr:unnamed protein product [Actinomadura parvosata subsp. kistnae]
MYAVIRAYTTKAGSAEDVFSQVDSEFADRIPKQVGALLYTAVDTGDGSALTVTFFADEQAADRSETAVSQVQQSLAARFGIEEAGVRRGPVMVSRAEAAVAHPVNIGDRRS